ncbi:hypothetical protein HDU76_002643 [Blyttiomyces sp. JEL0837]|nr:hypothetical protein HDU76_002643 [Blyttiomyces sp. JEL0837]
MSTIYPTQETLGAPWFYVAMAAIAVAEGTKMAHIILPQFDNSSSSPTSNSSTGKKKRKLKSSNMKVDSGKDLKSMVDGDLGFDNVKKGNADGFEEMDMYDDDYDVYRFYPSSHLKTNEKEMIKLEEKGLDYFKVFFGPASGPKTFTTVGFERQISQLIQQEKLSDQKWLVGASTSALRFMSLLASFATNEDVTNKLKEHFCQMYYKQGDTPQVLRPMMEECYRICAPTEYLEEILSNKNLRIAILVANIHERFRDLSEWQFKTVLASFALSNLIHPGYISGLVSRICFYSGDEEPTFLERGLGGKEAVLFVKLTKENVYEVLHATTCIPFVQEPCTYITGVGEGLYVDGALTDYTVNCHITDPTIPALLLSDTLSRDNIRPTVFDSYVPWRRPPSQLFDHCSVLCPNLNFMELLPDKRLPSVKDWFDKRYISEPGLRHENWRRCFELSVERWPKELADLEHF